MLSQLTDTSETLKGEVERVNAALVIQNPTAVRGAIEGLLGTMYDIIQDQKTLSELAGDVTADGDIESPYDEPLAFLSLARSIIPHSMLRPATVLLFILHHSIDFRASERLEETTLLARVDETLGSFGLESVSLVQLWEKTGEYEDQRQRLWASVVTLLLTVGDHCVIPDPPPPSTGLAPTPPSLE